MPANRTVALFCLVLIAHLRGATSVQADSAEPNQQKARAVINQMVAALGGQAYLNIQDIESEGRYGRFYQGRSEGGTEFHRFWQWPDKERVEFTKQRDVAQLTVGDTIYEITFRGSRLVDSQKNNDARIYLERRRFALETVLRQWLNQPGIALFDEGPALAENHPVERITLINSNNNAITLSIDTTTHLPLKKSFVIKAPQGYRDEIAEVYDNWKMVQGINTPYNTLVMRNGDLDRQYFLSSVRYNSHLPDSLFSPLSPRKP
jgi:hypothetical protein